MKPTKNQPTINDAFKKIIKKDEDLPSKVSVRQMWKDLEKKSEKPKESESEKKKVELEKLAEVRKSTMKTNNLKLKEKINENEIIKQQQQKQTKR